MPYKGDDESLADLEFPKALEPPWKKAVKVVGVVAGLTALVGYGIWIGTIQANIAELKKLEDDVKETKNSFLSLDHRVTDRLDRFRDSFDLKDERNRIAIGDLKDALFAFSTEMRYRHNTEPPAKPLIIESLPPEADPGISNKIDNKLISVMTKIKSYSVIEPPITTPSPRRATKREINEAAKKTDHALQKALTEEIDETKGILIYAR